MTTIKSTVDRESLKVTGPSCSDDAAVKDMPRRES